MMTGCNTVKREQVRLSYPVESGSTVTADSTVIWDDSAFVGEQTAFDSDTARICAVLCACAGSSDIAQENLTALEFEKTAKFSYEKSYRGDRVGVLFSKRQIGDQTLVGVIIRGTVGKEWYSNFDIGYGEEHAGFAACADFVEDKLHMYLVNYGLTDQAVTYLVTGYSRGGAVANIVAQRLIEQNSGTVRAYTFASPHTTTRANAAQYAGIYNLIREEDFFTYVPLTEWGYRRYGTDISLTSTRTATPDHVQSVFRDVTGSDYVGFENAQAIEQFTDTAAKMSPTVRDYYERTAAVGDTEMSMHDYMMLAARFLAGEDSESDADLLADTLASDYADLTLFFMSGIDMEEWMLKGDLTRSSVADAHAYVIYMAALDTL